MTIEEEIKELMKDLTSSISNDRPISHILIDNTRILLGFMDILLRLYDEMEQTKAESVRLLEEYLIADKRFHELAGDSDALDSGLNLRQALDRIQALEAENARLKALTEWRPIEEAPQGGRPFWINSGPIPGYAMQTNTEEPGCEIEWFYNTHRTSGWTNSLTSIATHWAEIQKGPTPEVTP